MFRVFLQLHVPLFMYHSADVAHKSAQCYVFLHPSGMCCSVFHHFGGKFTDKCGNSFNKHVL